MKQPILTVTCLILSALVLLPNLYAGKEDVTANEHTVTIESLFEEMVSVESDSCFPVPYYSARQLTSYDRRSVAPGTPGWHANDDWSGFVRYEANNGRSEKVLFDEEGPGVITRIITTGGDHGARLRFYFDGEAEASIVLPTFDIATFPGEIPTAMLYLHQHYPTMKGCSFYYPLPYARRCKITVDNVMRNNYVYHVNYRKYEPGTKVETFSLERAEKAGEAAARAGHRLDHPITYADGQNIASRKIGKNETLTLNLPSGELDGAKAIRTLRFELDDYDAKQYDRLTRGLIVKIRFDGRQTVWVPLSDFSGGGMGAPRVDCWYLESDGQGRFLLRFVMPYCHEARIELENATEIPVKAKIEACVSSWDRKPETLYFHATWRQERNLRLNEGRDYLMGHLFGRGVFKADVLSLYNHTPKWYGEGDEHIWVDGESFPSHFGCGTEDYYNTTYAPIRVFHNAFGGAPREDDPASRGYNTFLRTRNLDGIPFRSEMKFEFELIGWENGVVDYASTLFWYGDLDSRAEFSSGKEEALVPLPPPITSNGAD